MRVPTDNVKMRMQVGAGAHSSSSSSSSVIATVREIIAPASSTPTSTSTSSAAVGAGAVRVGGLRALYKGYAATLFRDVPFAAIQFPIYEALRSFLINRSLQNTMNNNIDNDNSNMDSRPDVRKASSSSSSSSPPLSPSSSSHRGELGLVPTALCGGAAGSVAALLTCPLDVIKTRYQLAGAQDAGRKSPWHTAVALVHEGRALKPEAPWKGVASVLFLGVGPRVGWISIGGCVFFGAFETARHFIERGAYKIL